MRNSFGRDTAGRYDSALSDALTSTCISSVYEALGGGTRGRNQRFRAIYRNGDGYSVALNDDKGCWYDFVEGIGGGILDLIQKVLRCDRRTAIEWFCDFAGIKSERKRRNPVAWRRSLAHADELIAWRDRILEDLRLQRNEALRGFHLAKKYIIQCGLDAQFGADAADIADENESRYQELEVGIDGLTSASWEVLAGLYLEEVSK